MVENLKQEITCQNLKIYIILKIHFTSGYQWGQGKGKGQYRSMRLRSTNYYV